MLEILAWIVAGIVAIILIGVIIIELLDLHSDDSEWWYG